VYYSLIGKFWMQVREADLAMGQRIGNRIKPARRDQAVAILSYSLVMAALMGCEQTPPTPGTGRLPGVGDLIVLIGPPQSSPQSAGIAGGARRPLERYPALELQTVAPADDRSETLMRVVDEVLAKDPKVVCLYVSSRATAETAARTVLADNAMLVTLGVDLRMPGVFGHVDEDLPAAAGLLGKHLDTIIADKHSYVLVHHAGRSPKDTQCYDRLVEIGVL
jgi:hypothetical protein